jgi:hypothetical protein
VAEFDRIDGVFVATRCTLAEKGLFQRAGWVVDPKLRRWATVEPERAIPLLAHAVGAAKTYIENAVLIRDAAMQASWAETTDKQYPAPEGKVYMDFQRAGIEYTLTRTRTLIGDAPGLGKSLKTNEKLLYEDGWREINYVKVGDRIFGSKGHLTTVTGVFPQGTLPTFKVTFSDTSEVQCSADHLWTIDSKYWGDKTRTLTVSEMLNRGLYNSDRPKYSLPAICPVEHSSKEFVIQPYTMGYLLGNGYFGAQISATIPLGGEEIAERIASEISLDCYVKAQPPRRGAIQYRITKIHRSNKLNPYTGEVRRMGLYRELGNKKHIPQEYFYGSVEQRLALMRGLMDADGCAEKGNSNVFYTTSPQLAEDVCTLAKSLAGFGKVREKAVGGFATDGSNMYKVAVYLGPLNPFFWSEKATKTTPKNPKVGRKRFVTSIVPAEDSEQICISVDAPDKLFLTTGYTVTHNTIQAIGVHNATATKRILIVCPASLKVNWEREWRTWDVHERSVGIAKSVLESDPVFEEDGTRARNPDTGALIYNNWTRHDWPETDVVIVNYDMLLTFDKQIKMREWDLAVFDEAHMLKTATTIRTMCVFGGKKAAIKKDGKTVTKSIPLSPVRAKRHLYLTGTPILSKPVELWTLLQACDPRGLGRNWLDFVYEFCGAYDDEFGMKYDGASNLDKLNRLLRERFMVRRDKKSVLKDLPPKTRELVLLPSDKLEKPIKKEKSRVEQAFEAFEGMMGLDSDTDFRFIAQIDGLMDRIGSALSNQSGEEPDWNAAIRSLSEPDQIAFTELSEAREEVALAKVGLVTEHVKNLVDCGEPVILFAYHKSVIAELEKRLTKCGFRVGIVTGSVQPNKRQAVVDAFQNGDLDIIIGNILAMGVGFTLTRASFVVFAELDWVPAMIEQAEDRAWRHGQKNAVTIQHLVVDGSIEAHMITIILEKMLVIFDALDAKEAV